MHTIIRLLSTKENPVYSTCILDCTYKTHLNWIYALYRKLIEFSFEIKKNTPKRETAGMAREIERKRIFVYVDRCCEKYKIMG